MTSETHFLFDNIFANTHSELISLQEQIKEFQTVYQSNEEIVPFTSDESPLVNVLIEPYEPNFLSDESDLDDINNKFNLNDESSLNEPVLNEEQINKFKKIYLNCKIEDIDENNNNLNQKLQEKLNKKDEEA